MHAFDGQTDRQTDTQTDFDRKTVCMHSQSHGANGNQQWMRIKHGRCVSATWYVDNSRDGTCCRRGAVLRSSVRTFSVRSAREIMRWTLAHRCCLFRPSCSCSSNPARCRRHITHL